MNNDESQTFLFTFRHNGEAHGSRLVEVQVQQLEGNDSSVAEGLRRQAWYGTEESLSPMLASLGFAMLDVEGVVAALGSHREADRKLALTPEMLKKAGFLASA